MYFQAFDLFSSHWTNKIDKNHFAVRISIIDRFVLIVLKRQLRLLVVIY